VFATVCPLLSFTVVVSSAPKIWSNAHVAFVEPESRSGEMGFVAPPQAPPSDLRGSQCIQMSHASMNQLLLCDVLRHAMSAVGHEETCASLASTAAQPPTPDHEFTIRSRRTRAATTTNVDRSPANSTAHGVSRFRAEPPRLRGSLESLKGNGVRTQRSPDTSPLAWRRNTR
jgi:hypothetical protein